MADTETTKADETSTSSTSTSAPKAETTAAEKPGTTDAAPTGEPALTDETAAGIGAGPEGGPIPGDPSSEPVATAQQSWVQGRVGPPTIPQDAAADWYLPEGVTQLAPGEVAAADTPMVGGKIALAVPDPTTMGAGPYGGDTPADDKPSAIGQTKPGTDKPGPDELPPLTPTASDASGTGGPVQIPPTGKGTTAPDSSGTSPTSPTGEPASSGTSSAASAGTSEPADAAPSRESGASAPATSESGSTGSTEPKATTGSTSTETTTEPSSSGTSESASGSSSG